MLPEELLSQERERQPTDWSLVAKAIKHYRKANYSYLEVPWLVSNEAVRLTYSGPTPYQTSVGQLVGSAEQSFLELELEGLMPVQERFVTASPCWRNEKAYDEWHQTSFMKVELYSKGNCWEEFLSDAMELFIDLGLDNDSLVVVECPEGPYTEQWDLAIKLSNNKLIELGSYGYREEESLKWSYGTGLAEPRTSLLLNKLNC